MSRGIHQGMDHFTNNKQKEKKMLKYRDLTKFQKRYVHEIIKPEYRDHIKEFPVISLKEEKKLHILMRENTGVKIGMPTWMNDKNKVRKGRYLIPVPTEEELRRNEDETTIPSQRKTRRRVFDESQNPDDLILSDEALESENQDYDFNDVNVQREFGLDIPFSRTSDYY